jgi:hypothetical protein
VGVRLHPITENPAVLEKLARVPSGTMRRLNSLKAVKVCTRKGVDYYLVAGVSHLMPRRDFNDSEQIWEAEWKATQSDPDVTRLDSFLMEGWGKMRSVPTATFRSLGMLDDQDGLTDGGQLDDPAKVAELLSFMPDRVGGCLSWDKTELVLPNPHYGMLIGQVRVPLSDLGGVHWC